MFPTERRARGRLVPARRAGPLLALAKEEDGMVSLVTVIAVCMFLILAGMVANVAQVVRAKIVAQNAADGVAQSVALVRARGLNAITAANHLIGELEALVILHHAVGGDKLDRGARSSPDSAVLAELDMAYEAAAALEENEFLGPDSEVKSAVAEMPKGGATLKDSVIRLQQVLAWTYEAMAVGGALQKLKSVPYIGPFAYGLGLAINGAAKIYETKISLERKILTGLENLAGSSPVLGLKKALDQGAIQALHRLSLGLASENGAASRTPDVVEAIAEANAVADAASFPRLASPPARPEPDRVEPLANSQLVRSSYPWVNHWRSPILKFMKNWLILSRAHKHYHFYTDQFTEEKCREQKEQRGVHLLVLEDYDPNRVEKGGERWTFARGSDRADELFGAVGAARRPPPRLVSPGIFERANPDGVGARPSPDVQRQPPAPGLRGRDPARDWLGHPELGGAGPRVSPGGAESSDRRIGRSVGLPADHAELAGEARADDRRATRTGDVQLRRSSPGDSPGPAAGASGRDHRSVPDALT